MVGRGKWVFASIAALSVGMGGMGAVPAQSMDLVESDAASALAGEEMFYAGEWVADNKPSQSVSRNGILVGVDAQGRALIASNGRDESLSWTCPENRESTNKRKPYQQTAYVAFLERVRPNGELDTTFGSRGVIRIPQLAQTMALKSMAVLRDGATVLIVEGENAGCGSQPNIQRDVAMKIDPDGNVDFDWVSGGYMFTDRNGVFAIATHRDQLVVADQQSVHIFKGGEVKRVNLPPNTFSQSLAITDQWLAFDDVWERFFDDNGNPLPRRTATVWLSSNDAEHGTLSSPRRMEIPLDISPEFYPGGSRLAWDPQGRLIVVTAIQEKTELADSPTLQTVGAHFIISRVLVDQDGTARLDELFGNRGQVVFRRNAIDQPQAYSIAYQVGAGVDGGILVTGIAPLPGYGTTNMALRLNENGTFDQGFGSGGFVALPASAIMEGPAAIDRLGRYFGAAKVSAAELGTRAKPRQKSNVLRIDRAGRLAITQGSGWRPLSIPERSPGRLRLLTLTGCNSAGERKVQAQVRVEGRRQEKWRPVANARVDLAAQVGPNIITLERVRTNGKGRAVVSANVTGPTTIWVVASFSQSHIGVAVSRKC